MPANAVPFLIGVAVGYVVIPRVISVVASRA